MDKDTTEKIMVAVIMKWGADTGPVDMAMLRASSDLAQKIMGVRIGGEYGKVKEAGKIIRQWANLQPDTKVDLTTERLARQLAKCVSANVGRDSNDKFTPLAGGSGGVTRGLW